MYCSYFDWIQQETSAEFFRGRYFPGDILITGWLFGVLPAAWIEKALAALNTQARKKAFR
jgi:hypothetical protein